MALIHEMQQIGKLKVDVEMKFGLSGSLEDVTAKTLALATALSGGAVDGAVVGDPERHLLAANDELARLRFELDLAAKELEQLRASTTAAAHVNAHAEEQLRLVTAERDREASSRRHLDAQLEREMERVRERDNIIDQLRRELASSKDSTAPAPEKDAPPVLPPETGAVDVVSDPAQSPDAGLHDHGGGYLVPPDAVEALRDGFSCPLARCERPGWLADAAAEKLEKPAGVASAVQSLEGPAQSPVDRIPAGTGDVVSQQDPEPRDQVAGTDGSTTSEGPASALAAQPEQEPSGTTTGSAVPGEGATASPAAANQSGVCTPCVSGDCDHCVVLQGFTRDCPCLKCGVEAQIAEAAGKKATAAIPDEAHVRRIFRVHGGRLDLGEVAFFGSLESTRAQAEAWRAGERMLRESTIEYLRAAPTKTPRAVQDREDEEMSLDAPKPEQAAAIRWGSVAGPAMAWHLWAGPDVAQAECGETTDEEVVFRDEVPEDGAENVCQDCLAVEVPAAVAWREALPKTCEVPGCGMNGALGDTAAGLWCERHDRLLEPEEKQSIMARKERLRAEASRGKPQAQLEIAAKRGRRCGGWNRAAGVACPSAAKDGSNFCGRHGGRTKKTPGQASSEVAGG